MSADYFADKVMDDEELRAAYRATYVKYQLQGVEMLKPEKLPLFQGVSGKPKRGRKPSLETLRLRELELQDQRLVLQILRGDEEVLRARWKLGHCLNCGGQCAGNRFCRGCYIVTQPMVKRTLRQLAWHLQMSSSSPTFV